MESLPAEHTQQQSAEDIYNYAAILLYREKWSHTDVMASLKSRGLDEQSAAVVIENVEKQIKGLRQAAGKKDMLYGALWCVGGTVLTLADIGFIFWGAIVFGGIQFFRGVSKL